jgi:hypothetical protein
VVEAALRHGGTIYAARELHTAYIDALWYGVVAGRSPSSFVILDRGDNGPPGALLVGMIGDCPECKTVFENGEYRAYLRPS